ncbi:MAG: ribosome biogenesis GTPase Der [Cytophagaceae bacterium]|nr:ribosome biogenesis GTPase Der [Cytophagaceae bacterium]MDW8455728.1 ribosome biogenesis GTPase Der [Cytophagaceae bacterium]
MANIVAIVGRPNVGKSTLFNRLVGTRDAIMDDESGVTRDRHYGHCVWNNIYFTVIDTGGYVHNSDDIFEKQIREQVELAIEEADVILFVVDTHTGLHYLDQEFANRLRDTKKPIYVVANKADTNNHAHMAGEFYKLGFDNIFPVSSQNGSGTGDLLDAVVAHFPDHGVENPYEGVPRICVLGRPNAGKSSFVNTLLGKNRSIVTEIAGTTRDAVDAVYNAFGKKFIITDTAGIRKRAKIKEDIEFYSILRSVKALENSDVCIVMVDAQRGFEAQDLHIIAMAAEKRKGIVILVNKWDLIYKETNTAKKFQDEIYKKIAPLTYIPILFISVKEKIRIFQAVEKTIEVYNNMNKKIPTSELNEIMLAEIERYPPPAIKGKYVKIKYVTQLPSRSVSFAFFCNLPQYIKEPYKRFLENKIREHFKFEGVPINIICKAK